MAPYQEETSLFEVFQPLVQRWKLIAVGVLAGVLAAAVFTFLSKKQYETSMLLQVGAILDKQIEESSTVVEIINSDSFHQTVASRLKLDTSLRQLRKMIRAETNTVRPSPIVTVTVLSDSPDGAIQLARVVADVVNERHRPLFDEKMSYYNNWMDQLESKLNTYEAEAKAMRQDLNNFRSHNRELSTMLLLEARLGDREAQAFSWRRELRELLAYRTKVHSHNTAMVAPPVLPSRPSKPNVMLNLLVAFFVSFFLMISIVLVTDQYRKASLRI